MKIFILTFLLLTLNGCSIFYLGIKDYDNFDPKIQADNLGDIVDVWEDGRRTNSNNGEYEWWYFDSKLDDGAVIVAYFWTLKAFKDIFYIGVNYNHPDGTSYKKIKFFKKKDVFIEKTKCNLKYSDNIFQGDLKNYKVKISP